MASERPSALKASLPGARFGALVLGALACGALCFGAPLTCSWVSTGSALPPPTTLSRLKNCLKKSSLEKGKEPLAADGVQACTRIVDDAASGYGWAKKGQSR